jgi:predicted RNA-binding Zn-ribbon protein involved in translation (DUF1610 family)
MGSRPILEYFWVKVLEDGTTTIPQFDLETGKENYWKNDNSKLSKVLFMPFTEELAKKVVSNGNLAMANMLPTIEFTVKPDEFVEAGRDNEVCIYDYFKCDICGWEFQYVKTPDSNFAKCPQCGNQDDWYCSRCKEYKTEHRITEKNQAQCLDCDIPIGLDRTKRLIRMQGVKHRCDYFIRSKDRKLTIKYNGNVILE